MKILNDAKVVDFLQKENTPKEGDLRHLAELIWE
jgi:hypothetical protein